MPTAVGWPEAVLPEPGPASVSVRGSLLSVSGFGIAVCQATDAALQTTLLYLWRSTLVLSGLILGQVDAASQ